MTMRRRFGALMNSKNLYRVKHFLVVVHVVKLNRCVVNLVMHVKCMYVHSIIMTMDMIHAESIKSQMFIVIVATAS